MDKAPLIFAGVAVLAAGAHMVYQQKVSNEQSTTLRADRSVDNPNPKVDNVCNRPGVGIKEITYPDGTKIVCN